MIFKMLKDLFFHRAGRGRKWGPRGGRTGRASARQTYPRTRGRCWRTSCWRTSKWRLWMMTSSKVCRKTSIFVEEFFIEFIWLNILYWKWCFCRMEASFRWKLAGENIFWKICCPNFCLHFGASIIRRRDLGWRLRRTGSTWSSLFSFSFDKH